jgi:hypothetical protein
VLANASRGAGLAGGAPRALCSTSGCRARRARRGQGARPRCASIHVGRVGTSMLRPRPHRRGRQTPSRCVTPRPRAERNPAETDEIHLRSETSGEIVIFDPEATQPLGSGAKLRAHGEMGKREWERARARMGARRAGRSCGRLGLHEADGSGGRHAGVRACFERLPRRYATPLQRRRLGVGHRRALSPRHVHRRARVRRAGRAHRVYRVGRLHARLGR